MLNRNNKIYFEKFLQLKDSIQNKIPYEIFFQKESKFNYLSKAFLNKIFYYSFTFDYHLPT